jgi:hypothetical protein
MDVVLWVLGTDFALQFEYLDRRMFVLQIVVISLLMDLDWI